jgi:hypothetical protein
MARHLLIAGVDFGTSFTKVVLRDNNTPGQNAVVVTFPGHADGLLPSLVGIGHDCLLPPVSLGESAKVPYLKMLAAHVANREALDATHVRIPAALAALRRSRSDGEIVRELLAFYFAHVMAVTEDFIRCRSPWRDFDFTPGNQNDFLIFQLAVPTGLLADNGATERLFRDAFIAAHELRRGMDTTMRAATPQQLWSEQVTKVFSGDRAALESRFEWQCLLYPEVAAAVQTVFRSPNARDGLYITMDVGAGTVDLNAFLRFSGQVRQRENGGTAARRLDYYSAIVCPLGVQNLDDQHDAMLRRVESDLMEELRTNLHALYLRALIHQPNHGAPGNKTWDRASLFIFGGGSHHRGYRHNFSAGLDRAGIHEPQVYNLPAAQDLTHPRGVEFGRFAVAYGLSFFRPSLDHVRLPHELTPFRELYPEHNDEPPRQYGINWDD